MNLKLHGVKTHQEVLNARSGLLCECSGPKRAYQQVCQGCWDKATPVVDGSKKRLCDSFGKSGEHTRAEAMRWARERDPKRFMLYSVKQGAKKRGIECQLSVADIPDIPTHCPIFPWIVLEHKVGAGKSDGSPSVDRINNLIGYVKGNVRIISSRANQLKSNATDQELVHLGADGSSRQG